MCNKAVIGEHKFWNVVFEKVINIFLNNELIAIPGMGSKEPFVVKVTGGTKPNPQGTEV